MPVSRIALALASSCSLFAWSRAVWAGPPEVATTPSAEPTSEPPAKLADRHSIQYSSLLTPRLNPLGLQEALWVGYQYRLYRKTAPLFRDSNLGLFLRPTTSPAIALIGPTLQYQPLAILRFRLTWSFVGWFGNFDFMESYQSPWDDFSDTRVDEQTRKHENYSTTGHQTELEVLFQIRYRGLVLRNTFVADYNDMKLRGDDDLYFDVRIDALVPNRGWVLSDDIDLLWFTDFAGPRHATLITGARATLVDAIYPDSVYEPGDERRDPNGPTLRLGPMLGWVFYDRPDVHPRFNKPTLLLLSQWHILHRWRTGRDVSQGYPTLVVALMFSGQLWGKSDER
ncbi:hypothetical protein ACNOYE_20690 [Nannocystaceae bacterium ST9]